MIKNRATTNAIVSAGKMIYNGQRKLAAMYKAEQEALVGEALADGEELKERGHFIVAQVTC